MTSDQTMTGAWLAAFPVQQASAAAEALCQAWRELVALPGSGLNPRAKETTLTKSLKVYIENHAAQQFGLLGIWAAEDIIGDVDPQTGEWLEERRTDIVYGWNDQTRQLKLVFEFKRLGKQKRYQDQYLGKNGLERFVTGIYSRREAMAAMVGVLLDPKPQVVPPIREALAQPDTAARLRLRPAANGSACLTPLFPVADFDTEHARDPAPAPAHGQLRVAHIFLSFGP